MKKFVLFLFPAVICLCLTVNFAQSRRVTPTSDDAVKKVNKREPKPEATATPPPTNTSQSETNADENAEVDDTDVIKVETELVTIPVKVVDRQGRFVGGLTKENFKVLEDNLEQEIAYFSNEQVPFTVALILDMSFSAKFKAEEIQTAALQFVNQLRPNDKVMVVSFDEQIYINCEPTNDRKVIQTAIRGTKISYGTSLYDAMDLVINQKLRKISGRKAIVLFSDGVDTTSQKTFSMKNLSDALELDALIYPIRYDTFQEVQAMKNKPIIMKPPTQSPIPSKNKSPLPFPIPTSTVGTPDAKGTSAEEYRQADEYLNDLANRTGGRVYPASTLSNLSSAFSNIASELREYYSLGFYPKDTTESKKHKIKVRVDQQGVAVKARDSYSVKSKK